LHREYQDQEDQDQDHFLKRNLRKCPPKVKEQSYKTLVRPMVEYASTVWDPHTKSNIQKLERVQRQAARFVKNDFSYYSSVSKMLQDLQWESLEHRRAKVKAIMIYRILHGLIAIPAWPDLVNSPRSEYKLVQIQPRLDVYKYSFFPSAIRVWNSLPPTVQASKDLDSFKIAVQKIKM